MRTKLTKIIAGIAAIAALALGGAALATAGQGDSKPSAPAAALQQGAAKAANDSVEEQSPAYRASITAPEQEGVSEQEEAAALQAKATVTPAQAKSAALVAVPGTAGKVELDNENGNVVYSVEITKGDGTVVDVKIDAGNAKVLHQESDDDREQSEGPEQPEQSETHEQAGN